MIHKDGGFVVRDGSRILEGTRVFDRKNEN